MNPPSPRPGLPTHICVPPRSDPRIVLWLDSNEGPRAASRRFAGAQLEAETMRCYPRDRRLRRVVAQRFGVDEAQVVLGAGADELLDRTCRAYLAPGRRLVAPSPCFPMLAHYGQLAGAELVFVPWHRGRLPRVQMLARVREVEAAAVVFATTPNNPTGLSIGTDELLELADALPGALVVADLAYVEFQHDDPTAALLTRKNVLVVRTLSKGYGLAGLRVGYALGTEQVVAPLLACGSPFPVAGPALALATAALRLGPERDAIAAVRAERTRLAEALSERGFDVLPSEANFVFARAVAAEAATGFAAALRDRGIAIRTFAADDPFLAAAVRITCPGDGPDFDRLLAAMPGANVR